MRTTRILIVGCGLAIGTALALAADRPTGKDDAETTRERPMRHVAPAADGIAEFLSGGDLTGAGGPGGHRGGGHHHPHFTLCRMLCGQEAIAARQSCLDEGGTPPDCHAAAHEAFVGCVEVECACEASCHQAAVAAFTECHDAGGAWPECRAEAQAARTACLENECGYDFTCIADCGAAAQETFATCIDDGGTMMECRAAARAARLACLPTCIGE